MCVTNYSYGKWYLVPGNITVFSYLRNRVFVRRFEVLFTVGLLSKGNVGVTRPSVLLLSTLLCVGFGGLRDRGLSMRGFSIIVFLFVIWKEFKAMTIELLRSAVGLKACQVTFISVCEMCLTYEGFKKVFIFHPLGALLLVHESGVVIFVFDRKLLERQLQILNSEWFNLSLMKKSVQVAIPW